MIFLGMRLAWALRNPKMWGVALVAGALGSRLHGEHARASAFAGYAIAAVVTAMLMPMTFRNSQIHIYFVFGLVPGAIVGALQPPPPVDGEPDGNGAKARGLGALKGAALGAGTNVVLAFATYA